MQNRVDQIIEQNGAAESALLAVLMDIQGEYNYLPRPALEHVAKKLNVSMSRISYMATFFTAFSLEERGKAAAARRQSRGGAGDAEQAAAADPPRGGLCVIRVCGCHDPCRLSSASSSGVRLRPSWACRPERHARHDRYFRRGSYGPHRRSHS